MTGRGLVGLAAVLVGVVALLVVALLVAAPVVALLVVAVLVVGVGLLVVALLLRVLAVGVRGVPVLLVALLVVAVLVVGVGLLVVTLRGVLVVALLVVLLDLGVHHRRLRGALQGRAADLVEALRALDGLQGRAEAGGAGVADTGEVVVEAELGGAAVAVVGRPLGGRLLVGEDPGDGELLLRLRRGPALGDERREHDQRGGAGRLAGRAELDADVVPLGEPADHEQAHAAGDGGVDRGRLGQLLVDLGEVLGGETDALVVDLDQHAAVRQAGRVDEHPGLRAGERGGVLQQLGEQVDEVGHGGAYDVDLRDAGELDTLVLLHLGGGGAEHVDQRDRGVPAAAGLLAREDEQVLTVAAHTGREVVQLEEVLQLVRVGLVVLQVGDQRQLALDEALAAARQVGEDRVDVPSEQGLLGGERHGLLVHLVERPGDFADLVLAVQRDRGHRGVDPVGVGLGELLDQVRQAVVGDLQGGAAQGAHAEDHRAGHVAGEQAGQDQCGDDDDRVEDGVVERVVLEVAGVGEDVLQQHDLGVPQGLDVGVGGLVPVVRGQTGGLRLGERGVGGGLALHLALGGGLAVHGGQGHHALHGRHAAVRHLERRAVLGVQGDLGVRVLPDVLGGTTGGELVEGDLLQLLRDQDLLGRVGVLVPGGAVLRDADQQAQHQRALGRGGGLGQRHRVDRAALAGGVGGAQADRVVVGQQRGEHHRVGAGRRAEEQLGAVRVGPQVRQVDEQRLEGVVAARQLTGLVGGRVGGVVRLQRGVGVAAALGDLVVRVLLGEQGYQRLVALVLQRLGEFGRRLGQLGGLLGARGLDVAVDRGVHSQTTEDETDDHGDQQDRDQAGRHAPVARA